MASIRVGQRWKNKEQESVIEVLRQDVERPERWIVLLRSSNLTVSLAEAEIIGRYELRE